jgi:hypothetical protein
VLLNEGLTSGEIEELVGDKVIHTIDTANDSTGVPI